MYFLRFSTSILEGIKILAVEMSTIETMMIIVLLWQPDQDPTDELTVSILFENPPRKWQKLITIISFEKGLIRYICWKDFG